MKKILFITLATACTFLSCKKSNDSSYYFRCSIDGTARTFNVGTFAHKEDYGGQYAYQTGGFATSSTSGDWMGFYIDNTPSSDDINPGTSIKGTFSGDFYPEGNLDGIKKSITNGEFHLKWQ